MFFQFYILSQKQTSNFIVLYCIVLYCIVLYFIVLYCIVLYCILLYCIILYCIVFYFIVLFFYCIVLYYIVLYVKTPKPLDSPPPRPTLAAVVVKPSGDSVPVPVVPSGEGSIKVVFHPTEAGPHILKVAGWMGI